MSNPFLTPANAPEAAKATVPMTSKVLHRVPLKSQRSMIVFPLNFVR